MLLGQVRDLRRYPVKSMRGESLRTARVSERGIAYDRGYAPLDQETGKIASAKRPRLWGRLLQCQARVVSNDGAVRIVLPDGQELLASQDEADARLSALTGRSVRLARTPPPAPEIERYWPDVDGLYLRDTVTSGRFGLGAPEDTFFDYAPLHLMTTATLAHLQALYPRGQVDPRRFRPNLVIETPDDMQGFVENDWVGRTLAIGAEVRLRVTDPSPRCVVPTLPQGELAEDIGILRAVAEHNRPMAPALDGARRPSLGVYASVERGGLIHAGDTVREITGEQ
ncbi:MAG TPA: MOSC domain-containing protein [Ktedonobacterales bacterium]|nr:MOSC domain-containing protein [Ktedonobacterales bacterium]